MSVKSSSGTPKKIAVAPPDDFLQSLQWHSATKVGSVLNSNFTAPQAHCAVYFLLMSFTLRCWTLPDRSVNAHAWLPTSISGPGYFAFLFSISIRSLAAGPDDAGCWPVINWPSLTV